MELFACIAWLISNERNNIWQGKNMLKPETMISKAILFWKNSRRQIREKRKKERREWTGMLAGLHLLMDHTS